MTDDSTGAMPQEPRTSPIPLRKQPPSGGQHHARTGLRSASSGVVMPSNPGPHPGFGGPQHGNPQQGHQGAASHSYGPGGYTQNQYQEPVAYGPPLAYGPGFASTAIIARPAPNTALVVVAWIVAVCTFFYMLPWAVAATRGKSNQGAVGLLNFLLGWSFVGWVVALVMACTSEPRPIVVVQQNHYGNGYYR